MSIFDRLRTNMLGGTSPQRPKVHGFELFREFGGWFRQAFSSFNGNRDIYNVYGYKKRLMYQDYLLKYYRQDIATRIVKTPADAIWAYPPTFLDANVATVIKDLVDRLDLWQKLNRCDRISAMSPYSVLLVGLDDGQPLSAPVNSARANKVIFLQPYSAQAMPVSEYVTDATNPRFAKPMYYTINASQQNAKDMFTDLFAQLTTKPLAVNGRVHWSRIIHIADDLLEDDVFGTPRLGQVYNLLDDLLKVGGGSAEVYWLNSRGGLHIDVDKEMDLQADDADNMTDELDDYSNNLRRYIRTRGVKVTPLNMTSSDPTKIWEIILDLIAANTGMPQRMIIGSEAGQLASEQDRANWADYVKERRESFAQANVLRPLLVGLQVMGILKTTSPGVLVSWPDAFHMSPLERSQTSAQQARSAANLSKTIATTPELISIEEAQQIIRYATNSETQYTGQSPENLPSNVPPNPSVPTNPLPLPPSTAQVGAAS